MVIVDLIGLRPFFNAMRNPLLSQRVSSVCGSSRATLRNTPLQTAPAGETLRQAEGISAVSPSRCLSALSVNDIMVLALLFGKILEEALHCQIK
jgi:hypothetical protein